MKKINIFFGGVVAVILTAMVAWFFAHRNSFAVLNPEGNIGVQQRDLFFFACLLSLVVLVPVYTLLFFTAWRYRSSNKKATYKPKWTHSRLLETVWWGIPGILIVILAIITFKTSHDLDPYKPLSSNKKPITIQAIALEWKWLFIYEDYNIATVNYLEIPEKTPINFKITADAPMNSFWIPKLGGQVYAMKGMETKLHLIADKTGTYTGNSANLSGEGFAGMKFRVRSSTEKQFHDWVARAQKTSNTLTYDTYDGLAKPSTNHEETIYATVDSKLYSTILHKYMPHSSGQKTEKSKKYHSDNHTKIDHSHTEAQHNTHEGMHH